MLQMPVWWAFFSSYDQSVGDYWVLQYDSDAGSDTKAFGCSISFLYALSVGDRHVLPYPRVLVYDTLLNRRILPNPNGNFSFSKQFFSFRISFIVISTEHYCILEVHIGAYPRTDSNHTVFYPAVIQETSVRNDWISDLTIVDHRWR